MKATVTRIAVLFSLFVLVAFLLFLANQTMQMVEFADRAREGAGPVVLVVLLTIYALCGVTPLLLLLRLPKPLTPPQSEDSPEFPRHLEAVMHRLQLNPLVRGAPLSSRDDIEQALGILDERADEVVTKTASGVFVTTAVCQNGSLDVLMVLVAHIRMVWEIAHVYYQRPALKELLYLYSNVASTAFIVGQLDDVDLSEQMDPIVDTALGSVVTLVPGMGPATSLLINSIFSGSVNAFLTLRVGIIARQYCGCLVVPERRRVRRSATVAATRMLGPIAVNGAKMVAGALARSVGRRACKLSRGLGGKVDESRASLVVKSRGLGDRVRESGESLVERLRPSRRGRSAARGEEQGCG